MAPSLIAVDLGGTQIRAAVCDADGQIYKRVARLTHASEGPAAVLARINETIAEAADGASIEAVAGIGIGAPGPLDPTSGTILAAPNLPGWVNVPLRNLVSAHFGKPTFLGNDANVAGLAELTYGAARGVRDLIYLTISTGIGSGIVVDGRMLLGARGLAAEAGHTIIKPDGPKCGCGNRGCVETFAAGPAISRDVVGRLKAGKASKITRLVGGDLDKVDARVISEAAAAGDKLAVNAFRRAGKYLGLGIVNLLHLFNPRMIVLGGSVTKAGPLLFDPMWEAIRARAMPAYLEGLSIVPAALGDDVGLLGALALAVTELKIERT
jgi:glucokinase